MKKYEYVSLKMGGFWRSGNEEHRAVIDRYAANGWRYVGFVPTEIEGYGRITRIDLIFERDV